jgi:hypothetical protein
VSSLLNNPSSGTYSLDCTGTACTPVTASSGGGGVPNVFPSNMRLSVEGASITAGFNEQQEVYLSSVTPGTGYTGTGTATVAAFSPACTVPPTVGVYVDPDTGGLDFSITNFGQGCGTSGATAAVTVSGFSTGSGASAVVKTYGAAYSPWSQILETQSVLNGNVASYTNYAIGGTQVSQAIARFTSNSYATICGSSSYKEYFIVGGDLAMNSIQNGGLTAAQTYQQWIALTHALKSAGCKVIVATGTPYGDSAADPTIAQFDQLVRNGQQGVDYDYLVDFGAQIQNYNDPQFFSYTGIHFTQSGEYLAATIANGALANGGLPNSIGAPINLSQYLFLPLTVTNMDSNAAITNGTDSVSTNTFFPGLNYRTTSGGGSIGVAYGGDTSGAPYVFNFEHNYASGWRWCSYTLGTALATPSQFNACITLPIPTANEGILLSSAAASASMDTNQTFATGAGYPGTSNTFLPGANYTSGGSGTATGCGEAANSLGYTLDCFSPDTYRNGWSWSAYPYGTPLTTPSVETYRWWMPLPTSSESGQIASRAWVNANFLKVNTCGTTTTCSNTAQSSPRVVWGTVTLSSGTATVGSMTAWTSTTSFVCTPNDTTTAGGAKITNTSTSSITIAGGTSDVVNYVCVGN